MSVLLGADYGKLLVNRENPQFDHCSPSTASDRLEGFQGSFEGSCKGPLKASVRVQVAIRKSGVRMREVCLGRCCLFGYRPIKGFSIIDGR